MSLSLAKLCWPDPSMGAKPLRWKYSPHVLAFISGAIVLLLEILGARILAPYLGTAFSVWVNVIGAILASLSLGYYAGGVLADRNPRLLPHIFLAAALACALVYFERPLLPRFGTLGLGWGSLLAAIVYFAPASAILGMVSPYLLKLAAADPKRIGRASGGIFAASTLGSIAGTFAGGFWLIPHLSIPHILAGVVVLLLVLSLACAGGLRPNWDILVFASAAAGLLALAQFGPQAALHSARNIYEKNSQYYNIRVNDEADGKVRLLLLDGSPNSGRFVGMPGMPFPYVGLSAEIIHQLKPAPQSALTLGGGGYSIPEFIKRYSPQTEVTVVEIDPEVTATAQRFFLDEPAMPITTINEDARVFLNRNQRQFDVIYTDVYSGAFSIPPTLATREAFQAMQRALRPDGVIVFNIVSALEGPYAAVYESLIRTLREAFPNPAIFATHTEQPALPQNVIVVAGNQGLPLPEPALRAYEDSRWRKTAAAGMLLTDDYAPTDYLVKDMVRAMYPGMRAIQ